MKPRAPTIEDIEAVSRRRLEGEELLAACSTRLLNVSAEAVDLAIDRVLSELGFFAGIDRSYVFQYSGDRLSMSNTHEWCAAGISPQIAELQNLSLSAVPRAVRAFEDEGVIHVPAVEALGSDWQSEREIFESGDIKSLIGVAMPVAGQVIGFVGLDAVRVAKTWAEDELRLLRLIADMLASALVRRRLEIERKNLEAQLFQAQKLEAIGRMAGGVAHDFNNLLSAIMGLADLAKLTLGPIHPVGRDLDDIRGTAERAAGLTRQLLSFSRRQTPQIKVLDLNLEIERLSSMMRRMVREDVEICLVLDAEIDRISADPVQITQILVNLVSNASDAMPLGGEIKVQTAPAHFRADDPSKPAELPAGDFVAISVTDQGLGLDPQLHHRVFEPFFTTKEMGKGTGLGLATVYGIVKQHRGHIEIDSEVGRGTTFHVYWPATQDEITAEVTMPAPHTFRDATILVAEDEDSLRDLVCRILRGEGYNVLAAANGPAALEVARHSGAIDLLLTDVIMPRMRGDELYRQARLIHSDLRVVFMSGYTDEVIAQAGLPTLISFLAKPFPPDRLRAKIAQELARA